MHETEFTVSREQYRQALRQWLWAMDSWSPAFGVVLLVGIAGMVFSPALRVMCAAFFGFAAAYFALLLLQILRERRNRRIYTVRLVFGDSGVASYSNLGDSSRPWSAFDQVLLTRDFVFFSVRSSQPIPVPLSALSEETVEFVLSRATAAGARIRGRREPDRGSKQSL